MKKGKKEREKEEKTPPTIKTFKAQLERSRKPEQSYIYLTNWIPNLKINSRLRLFD